MAIVTVGLSEQTENMLKRRAAEHRRSLEGEISYILDQAVAVDYATQQESFLEMSREVRKLTEERPQTPSEKLIREDRDNRDRNV